MFFTITSHQRQNVFTIFLKGFLSHPFDFFKISSIVRQTNDDLNQYLLVENLELGKALFLGLTGTPIFKAPKQFRVFNVLLAVNRGLGFFSFFRDKVNLSL